MGELVCVRADRIMTNDILFPMPKSEIISIGFCLWMLSNAEFESWHKHESLAKLVLFHANDVQLLVTGPHLFDVGGSVSVLVKHFYRRAAPFEFGQLFIASANGIIIITVWNWRYLETLHAVLISRALIRTFCDCRCACVCVCGARACLRICTMNVYHTHLWSTAHARSVRLHWLFVLLCFSFSCIFLCRSCELGRSLNTVFALHV